jgi:hypothetical protein
MTVIASLTPERAFIFRIVHRDNLPWILDNGLHCRNSPANDPNYVEIGNPDLIGKRNARPVPIAPGGTLSDYVPFYFTPRSPMLLNIKTGYNGVRQRSNDEIVIMVSSLNRLRELGHPFLFTNQHAYVQTTQFFSDLARLDQIDWPILQNSDFKRDVDDLGKFERYQAEALVRGVLPVTSLVGIACYNVAGVDRVAAQLAARHIAVPAAARTNWYF